MFWIENGRGINNIKAGFKPQLIIKFECLYFHHNEEREFHIPDQKNGSFDNLSDEEGTQFIDSNSGG